MTASASASTAQTNAGPSETPSRARTPPEDLAIRPATPADAAAIADIGARVFDATFAHTCSQADMDDYIRTNFTESVLSAELVDPNKVFTVACIGDKMAAFSCLTIGSHEPCVEHIPEAERIELQRLYADTSFHGRGVARALMDATLEEAKKKGYKYAWLGVWEHNYRARKFYERFGFEMVGSHDFWLGDECQKDDIFLVSL